MKYFLYSLLFVFFCAGSIFANDSQPCELLFFKNGIIKIKVDGVVYEANLVTSSDDCSELDLGEVCYKCGCLYFKLKDELDKVNYFIESLTLFNCEGKFDPKIYSSQLSYANGQKDAFYRCIELLFVR